jgi:5'-nucleotidase / UDP-sugar diphosphatase
MNRFFSPALLFFLLNYAIVQAFSGSDTTTVVIISCNDMHAKIDNFPKLKALVDNIRHENEYVLLVSAGDMFTGNPVVDQYPDKGYPMIDLMNAVGFDIGTIGNHEFDYGQEILKIRIEQARFPLISANFQSEDPNGLHPEPYKILTLKNGLKIAFIGAIQLNEAGLPDSHPSKLSGVVFTDGVNKIMEYRHLRDSCNVFIGLTHLGFETDVELAAKVGELDVILGGHSHTLVTNPAEYNNVLVMQASSGVKYISKVTLNLVEGKIVSKKAEAISVVDYPETDTTVLKMVDRYNDNKELNQVIGVALKDISGSDELGSLMTDGMCALGEIEIAFQNNGGIRIDNLTKGNITIKDMYKLDPFGNEVILMKLSVPEIKSLILNSFNRDKVIDLQVSGITYTVITDINGIGTEVRLNGPDGSTVADDRVFATGLSSYVASAYEFAHNDPGQSLYITTAQTLINFITLRKEIDYSGVKRTFMEPAKQ